MKCLTYGVRAVGGKVLVLLFLAMPVLAEPVKVLALGDSLTQGFGLPHDQGFVPQLETWLRGQGAEVEVINGGVSGDTTAGGAARVEWSLTPDVDAMIVTLGGNDFLRGLPPEMSRENLRTILEISKTNGVPVLLIGMQAPGNFGPEYKQSFDAIYPDLASEFGVHFFESFFAGLGQGGLSELQPYFQADGIHPNADGVGRIVAAIGPQTLELISEIGPGAQ